MAIHRAHLTQDLEDDLHIGMVLEVPNTFRNERIWHGLGNALREIPDHLIEFGVHVAHMRPVDGIRQQHQPAAGEALTFKGSRSVD
jgi:hypothetical protein